MLTKLRRRLVTVAIPLLLLASACGGDDGAGVRTLDESGSGAGSGSGSGSATESG